MITQTIDLCMIPGSTNPVIHVNQYDAYPGGLIFNLYEESAFEIPAGAAVTINGTKPDNYGFSYTASYSGNVVTADLEQQMTAVAGNVECELRVSLGSEIIGTQNFTLCVEEAALNNETIISDTDIPALVNAQRYASEAAASADDAEASADAAAGSATSAAASAEAAAQDFSSAVKYTDIVNNGTYSGTAGEKVLDAAYGKTLEDNKVAKSGDTMTGELKIQAQDITIGTLPSANIFSASRVTFEDSDGVRMGYLAPFYRTTDVNGYDISAVRTVNGNDVFNSLKLEVDASGNRSIAVSSATAWFDAINEPATINTGSIDDIVAPGYYYLPLNTVSDLPEGGNGILWVFAESQSNRIRQIFMRTDTAGTNDGIVYIRQSLNNQTGWGTWYKHGDATMYVLKSGDTMTGNLTVPEVYLSDGSRLYASTTGNVTIMTNDSGTSQARIVLTTAGRLAQQSRTRAATTDSWGDWDSWQYFDTWTNVTPTAGTNVGAIGSTMARYNPLTKLCCLNINIRIDGASIANSENLLTGLPKPVAAMQTAIASTTNDIVRVKFTTTGYMQADGAKTLASTKQYFNGYITYPYSSLS